MAHGNGSEEILRGDDELLFVSIHHYEPNVFPGCAEATSSRPGVKNVPLPTGFASEQFRDAMTRQVLPVLQEFQPQLLLISAGFGAHRHDALGGGALHEDDFGWATTALLGAVGPACPVVSVLEGGYLKSEVAGTTELTDMDSELVASVRSHVCALIQEEG